MKGSLWGLSGAQPIIFWRVVVSSVGVPSHTATKTTTTNTTTAHQRANLSTQTLGNINQFGNSSFNPRSLDGLDFWKKGAFFKREPPNFLACLQLSPTTNIYKLTTVLQIAAPLCLPSEFSHQLVLVEQHCCSPHLLSVLLSLSCCCHHLCCCCWVC